MRIEDLKNELVTGQGFKPSECTNKDLPSKLANYMVESLIEPIRKDQYFKESQKVRKKTLDLFKQILEPWQGVVTSSVYQIMKNKVIEVDTMSNEWY